ncbi:Ig-like domain-containing protein [Streptococcus infantis]|uniref:Ig-like domain-containing protein n=1 Tax=Streptococcus infantis TaxID=68892 RepID=UPI0039C04127
MNYFKKNTMRVFAFLGIIVLSLTVLTTVFAADVTDYTNKTSITVDGQPLTSDTQIGTGKVLEATNTISFPDTQQIKEGDVLVLDLPKELGLITKLEFPITHSSGEVIGNAVTDPSTQKVTITFTDYFSKNYKDKVMSLKYSVRPNVTNLPESGNYTFQFGTEKYTLNYNKTDGEAGDYEMKYGYQDSENPNRIKWRVVLNAVQDKLNNMVIKDDFSDSGQVLVESSFRAVRYATQPEKIPNEAALLKLEPIDNFSKKAEFTRNADGKITGFTINFGDNWNWAMYIEYTTELTSELPKGTQVANVLEWSASNFQKSRSVSALTRLETGSGEGSGDKTTTTTTTTTTTSTTTTTEEPTTTSTTTTTEEPTTTSTTTTTEEPTTTSTTTTTEGPTTTSTTTTTEGPTTTSTTTTTEGPTTISTTTTTEGPATTSTTTTTEGPTTTSTTTTTEGPVTTSTTTTTEEPTTTSTTTTTEEPTTTSTTTTTEGPATTSTTTTTEEPATTSTTASTEGPTTTSTTEGSTTTTDEKPKLPKTGEAVGTGLVFAGIVILSGTVVLKRKYSNK